MEHRHPWRWEDKTAYGHEVIRRSPLISITRVLACMLAVPITVLASAGTASARDGLAVTSTTTYTVVATSGVVRVLAEMTFTNTLPDTDEGGYIHRRYFSAFTLPAPAGALNPVASAADGTPLDVTGRFVEGNTDFFLLDVEFASPLFYEQTAHVNVTYDITGLPPRSDNPSRVNSAYAAFSAFGIGDPGEVTVKVVVPAGFEVDTFGSEAKVSTVDGATVYTATDIANPDEFDIFISARNDANLASTDVATSSGDLFRLRSWPGDTEWQGFVAEQIDTGLPALSLLIGQPWPIDDTVEVREAYTPYLYGYSGWFSAANNEIEIGEDLDQKVVLHELSHAWFNATWFSDRWLSEGFAQYYSNRAVESLGGEPQQPLTPLPSTVGKVQLEEWGDPDFVGGADEIEAYGYNASYWVVDQIVDDVGDQGMRAVLAAVADGEIAYVGEGAPETVDAKTDWRRFLDLVEEVGGADGAAQILEQYVVVPADAQLLDQRAETRARYSDLIDDGGGWAAPEVVRTAMSGWLFDDAQRAIDEAHDVLSLRDELDSKAAELGAGYPRTFESDYESAAGDLSGVTADVAAQIEVADALITAVAAEAEDDGVLDEVGLIGTDLPGLLDEAKSAFTAGDLVTAEAKAQKVVDIVADADDVGRRRLLLVAALLAALAVLLSGAAMLRRRQHRRHLVLLAPRTAPDPPANPPPESIRVPGHHPSDSGPPE